MSLLHAHNLTLSHGASPAVHHLNLSFPPQQLTAVIGPNGGGKSTLLAGLAGLIKPTTGRVEAQARVGLMEQQEPADFPLQARDVVLMGLQAQQQHWGRVRSQQWDQVQFYLDQVGLGTMADRLYQELSGGQRQRLRLARLLAEDAPILLLDEPFSALDGASTEAFLSRLLDLAHGGKTVVMVLHEPSCIAKTDFIVVLARELIHAEAANTIATQHWLDQAQWRLQHLREQDFNCGAVA